MPRGPTQTKLGQKDEGEKDSRRLGHSVIPEPLTPYPYIATAFFTVIFVNTPLNPCLATGFKTRKCNINAILRRFRSKRARQRTNRTNNASHEWLPHASRSFWHRNGGGNRIGWSLSARLWRGLSLVCRGLSSCRAVELDTLTPRHRAVRGGSVEVCRELSSSCRAITVE